MHSISVFILIIANLMLSFFPEEEEAKGSGFKSILAYRELKGSLGHIRQCLKYIKELRSPVPKICFCKKIYLCAACCLSVHMKYP